MTEKELLDDIRYLLKNTPILYQYMSMSGGKPFLENLKLMLKNPTIFNDPYDFYEGLISFEKIPKIFLEELIKTKESYKNLTENEVRKAFVDIAYPKQIEQQGISCFSEKGDNMLMWSHYSNSHTGICIGFDIVKLYYGLNLKQNQKSALIRVKYNDNLEPIEYFENKNTAIFNLFRTKAKCWNYEKEVRLTIFPMSFDNEKRELIDFNTDSIERIYLGSKIDKNDEEFIINYCTEKLPNVKLFKMELQRQSFKLIPRLIE